MFITIHRQSLPCCVRQPPKELFTNLFHHYFEPIMDRPLLQDQDFRRLQHRDVKLLLKFSTLMLS
jgi:hypothetical protein